MLGIAEQSFRKGTTALPFGQWQSLAPVIDLKKNNCLFLPSSFLSYQRLTYSTTGTMSLLLNEGLNPPLPPSKGNQIGCSGLGQKTKGNYLSNSIIHVAFIISFKSPAAVSFLALNLYCQQSPEQRFTSLNRYHLEWGEFLHFHPKQSKAQSHVGLQQQQQAMSKSNN